MVEEPEDGARVAALANVGEVEGPDDVRRHRLRHMVLEPAADAGGLELALAEHVGDKGLADRDPPPRSMQVVEGDRDLSASVVRHQGLEAQDLFVDPLRLGQVATACGGHRYLASAPSRFRPTTSGATRKDEQDREAGEESQDSCSIGCVSIRHSRNRGMTGIVGRRLVSCRSEESQVIPRGRR